MPCSPGTRARPCFLRESAPEETDEPGRIHGAEEDALDGRRAPGAWAPGGAVSLGRAPASGWRRTPARGRELGGAPGVVVPTHARMAAGRDLGWRPREAGPCRPRCRPARVSGPRLEARAGAAPEREWDGRRCGERRRRRRRRRLRGRKYWGSTRGLVRNEVWCVIFVGLFFYVGRWIAVERETGSLFLLARMDTTLLKSWTLTLAPNSRGINLD
jgi:hypothetical protein